MTAFRILLVDDEEAVLRTLERLLVREGFAVQTARSGEEAMARLEAGAIPHVILSDYRMPGMNGVTLLRRVRERWPRVQRVLVTGYADMHALEDAVNESQIYRFLAKPWDDSGLLATVRSAVEQWTLEEENVRLAALAAEQTQKLLEVNRDLERKVNERTALLSRAKREWEVAFDAIQSPLVILDADWQVVRGNLAFARQVNSDVRAIRGRRCHDLWAASPHPLPRDADGPCRGCPVRKVRAGAEHAEGELLSETGRTYLLGAYRIQSEIGDAVACIYRDMTDELAMQRQLTQADKLSAVGLLAGGVAHEINNPLGAILAFTQLLLRDRVDEAERREYLAEIETSALRCKEIVARLLSFSRQARRDENRSFDPNEVVGQVTFLVEKSYLPKGAVLERDLAPDVGRVSGNANELAQVLLNLVTNACDALPGGTGTIRVTTRNLPSESAVELAVSDSGVGIPEEDLGKIFDPFFTTKPEGKGTGLGLAVSWGIVRQMRGTIDVRSKVGEGSEFRVILPRAD